MLHVEHGLAVLARKSYGARMCLHYPPERILGQPPERLASPVAVPALPDPLVFLDGCARLHLGGSHRLSRLAAALKRAADDRVELERAKTGSQRLRLGATAIIERDTGRPAGQYGSRRRRQAVPHQQNQSHPPTL